ncbi:unnamed protein product [Nippostrongylus brasiliensis]|uniref:ATP-dependent NAD(P)H-hydrate dehydratase n=1 Tax=Nippostrongylus brasiliensis TaxID=27835 RepID=A0A0N4XIP7_NIPBR|nr:unnamed protein product [Nippostrongylus brasiliensis]
MDAIVLGPGLGRNPTVKLLVDGVVDFAKRTDVPLVVDADGLWFLKDSVRNMPALPSAILTPNMVEFSRLCESALDVRDVLSITDQQQLQKLATSLSEQLGISVFLKGREDIIANPDGEVAIGDDEGCPRRCGGQGDVISGTLAMFLLWASRQTSLKEATVPAGLACSQLVRRCAKLAFFSMGRSMITSDLIEKIPFVLQEIDK